MKLVNSGKVHGSNEWQNEFIVHNGIVEVHCGSNTINTFTLMSPEFKGQIFGGNNATNVIDVSNLRHNGIHYYNTLSDQSGNLYGTIDAGYITTTKINYFIGNAEGAETIHCSSDGDVVVDGKGTKNNHSQDNIYNCKQVTIYGNTIVTSRLCEQNLEKQLINK